MKSIFKSLLIGDAGERAVLEAIRSHLDSQNYLLVPKAKIADATFTAEIDLVLLHPTLGLFAIEVKNWKNFDLIHKHDPYKQAIRYKNLLLAQIEQKLKKIPINVEPRVIFPSISKEEGERFFAQNPHYANYRPITLFKEDLQTKEAFGRFFGASKGLIPQKRELLIVASLLVDKKELQERKRVAVLSLFELLGKIDFDFQKLGIDRQRDDLDAIFAKLKTKEATEEFRRKFRARLTKKPIDLFLCDETQDMPPNMMRVIYEEVGNAIFFVDEAQKFYRYSMDSVGEIFHHPDFPKLSMRGRVRNLKTIYRTPANIARCAFQILAKDTRLNQYYRKARYLQQDFLSDVRFVLEDGTIMVGDFNSPEALQRVIDQQPPQNGVAILTQYRSDVATLKERLKGENLSIFTFQSIKGLEADTIILHNFDKFLLTALKYEKEILLRKVYVLLTRAKERLYVSLPQDFFHPELQHILSTIDAFAKEAKKELPLKPATLVTKEQKEPSGPLIKELFKELLRAFA